MAILYHAIFINVNTVIMSKNKRNREFNIEASSLNVFKLLGLTFLYIVIGGVIGFLIPTIR